MGIFDSLKNAANSVSNAAKETIGGGSKSETFVFPYLPKNVQELQSLKEADLSTPFKTAALAIAILCNYSNDPDGTFAMLDAIKGPRPLSAYEKQFIRDRLAGKQYVTFSFFAGSNPQNNYTPSQPYTITVSEFAYSYQNEGYATLNVVSSGADSPRQIQLRKQGSTGKWFLWENYALSDIRVPQNQDPWA